MYFLAIIVSLIVDVAAVYYVLVIGLLGIFLIIYTIWTQYKLNSWCFYCGLTALCYVLVGLIFSYDFFWFGLTRDISVLNLTMICFITVAIIAMDELRVGVKRKYLIEYAHKVWTSTNRDLFDRIMNVDIVSYNEFQLPRKVIHSDPESDDHIVICISTDCSACRLLLTQLYDCLHLLKCNVDLVIVSSTKMELDYAIYEHSIYELTILFKQPNEIKSNYLSVRRNMPESIEALQDVRLPYTPALFYNYRLLPNSYKLIDLLNMVA